MFKLHVLCLKASMLVYVCAGRLGCRKSRALQLPNGERTPDIVVERLVGTGMYWHGAELTNSNLSVQVTRLDRSQVKVANKLAACEGH